MIEPQPLSKNPARRCDWCKPVVLLTLVVTLTVVGSSLDLGELIVQGRGRLQALGGWSYGVYGLLYVVLTVVGFPGLPFTVGAGLLFGLMGGMVVASVASTLGAGLSFLISRYVAREATQRWIGKRRSFMVLNRLSTDSGPLLVALTRLVPIFPFALVNYGFGLTKIGFGQYLWWSWLCMLPGSVLYVIGGDAAVQSFREGRLTWPLVVSGGLILVKATIVTCLARRYFRTHRSAQGGVGPE